MLRLAEWIEVGKGLLKIATGRSEEGYVPPSSAKPAAAAPAAEPSVRPDGKLTDHFSLNELTVTNNAALQAKNRVLTEEQKAKLKKVAGLLESVREVIGPVDVHSGYRCPELNGATPGSSNKSQHMLCEAADCSPAGPDTEETVEAAFKKLVEAAKAGKFRFGQLIVESAKRDYGRVYWIHISLGAPFRVAGRCGEVMRAAPDAAGKMVYSLIEKVPQEAA